MTEEKDDKEYEPCYGQSGEIVSYRPKGDEKPLSARPKVRVAKVVIEYPSDSAEFATVDELDDLLEALLSARSATFPEAPSFYQSRRRRKKVRGD